MEVLDARTSALADLETVSLAELDRAQLHDRVESKVVLTEDDIDLALRELSHDYLLLEHGGERLQQYRNDYFDTRDLSNYHDHHNQRADRIKLRYRTYVNSDLTFFELKRNLHGRTVKLRRATRPPKGTVSSPDAAFLFARTGLVSQQYVPSLTVTYKRVLLVKADFSERVTIDVDLTFRSSACTVSMPRLAICEFKQPRLDLRSPAIHAMRRRPQMFSKYCMGLASCDTTLRRNRFKKTFRSLETISVTPVAETTPPQDLGDSL